MTAITICPMKPADLSQVAAIHRAAFADSALTRLGTEAVRRYYEWQLCGPHEVAALAAWLAGQPDQPPTLAGFCFGGVFRGATGGFVRKNRVYLAGLLARRPWLVFNPLFRDRLRLALRALRWTRSDAPTVQPDAPRSFGILAVAVLPQHQGMGIGTRLMCEAEQIARARGFGQMDLSVHPANAQAIAFYHRLGWQAFPAGGAHWQGIMHKTWNQTWSE